MIFKCRFIKPKTSNWYNVESDSFEEAAQDFHGKFVPSSKDFSSVYFDRKTEDSGEYVYFALVEIEGYGQWVVRTYYSCIVRRGKFNPISKPSLQDIANSIGWEKDYKELLEYWTGEESPEKALKNKETHKGLYKTPSNVSQPLTCE